MARPKGKCWNLIGRVAVDSGQLVVCDPCYIDSEWIPNQSPQGHPPEVLTEEGKKRFPDQKDWSWRYDYGNPDNRYDTPQEALGGLSVNEAREQGYVKAMPQGSTDEFSYRGCCDSTLSEKGGGSLAFKMGHEGAGVAFSSGYGDGCYGVWGKRNAEGRIIEVRIIMDEYA